MPRRTDPAVELGVVSAILARKPRPSIVQETGVARSTVLWIASKYGLLTRLRSNSRYQLQPRDPGCWAKYANPAALERLVSSAAMGAKGLNGQIAVNLIGKHGNKAPCSSEIQACEETTRSPSCLVESSGG